MIKINEKGDKININFHKDKNKTEKINIISKDKEIQKSDKSTKIGIKNKGRNIIIKKDNKIIKRLSQDLSDNNIDISIQFTNKTINSLLAPKNKNHLSNSKSKKKKNLNTKLIKDLLDINKKINNEDGYLKKNYFHLHYQRHFGNEKNCTLCREMRQRGRISEHEKGLHTALSFRNLKHLNNRPLSKLRLSALPKEKDSNFFSSNNNLDDFKNKYLQFNEYNHNRKLNRFRSIESIANNRYENSNQKRNFRNYKLNLRKNKEKNKENGDGLQYSALKYYFKK